VPRDGSARRSGADDRGGCADTRARWKARKHRREKEARAATRGDKDGVAGVFRTINSAIVA